MHGPRRRRLEFLRERLARWTPERLAQHPEPWAVTRDTPIIALDAELSRQRAAAAAAASGAAAQPAEAGVRRCVCVKCVCVKCVCVKCVCVKKCCRAHVI